MIGQRRLAAPCLVFVWMLGLLGSATSPGMAAAQVAAPPTTATKTAINFPTSGSPDAQKIFLNGVELLHNFEYLEAIEVFQSAIKAQPEFAMAYWGLAMSYNHPLWEEQDLTSARSTLADLDKVSTANVTPRDKGFLDAVRILYGSGEKPARDAAYAEAMGRLYAQYPQDDEVGSFYGLALLGSQEGHRDFRVAVRPLASWRSSIFAIQIIPVFCTIWFIATTIPITPHSD